VAEQTDPSLYDMIDAFAGLVAEKTARLMVEPTPTQDDQPTDVDELDWLSTSRGDGVVTAGRIVLPDERGVLIFTAHAMGSHGGSGFTLTWQRPTGERVAMVPLDPVT